MEKIQIPQGMQRNIIWDSSTCEKHGIKRMVLSGDVVCPRCELEKHSQLLQEQEQERFDSLTINKKYNVFHLQSIVVDETLKDARLDTYKTEHEEEKQNKDTVLDAYERLLNGQVFNLVLQGKQGTGKSHLTYSILTALNESRKFTCLFITIDEMLRLIRDSITNKESIYTEHYFIDLLSGVDILGLDDLGAETGAIGTDKTATDFVQRVLYAVANARQKKATIITTNLSSEHLYKIYDKKLVSRLLKNPKVVRFIESKDKRISTFPF